jgi:hypothetical protein
VTGRRPALCDRSCITSKAADFVAQSGQFAVGRFVGVGTAVVAVEEMVEIVSSTERPLGELAATLDPQPVS